jgi:hypothetical protein
MTCWWGALSLLNQYETVLQAMSGHKLDLKMFEELILGFELDSAGVELKFQLVKQSLA